MRLPILFSLLFAACTGTKGDSGQPNDSSPTDSETGGGGFDTSHDGTCSTGSEWTQGNHGSSKMNPGQACIECHDRGEGPNYKIAGTIMGAIHDPDDCNGISGVTVRITDADGNLTELTTNSAGNFYSNDRISTPYTVQLEYNGITRDMAGAQTDGDCSTCHTQDGKSSAPGRAVVPY